MKRSVELARLLASRGWGVLPCWPGEHGKDPMLRAPRDDPGNEDGRLDWDAEALERWRDPRWQNPLKHGGSHQAVWCEADAVKIWRHPARGGSLVAVVRYEALIVDVDDPKLAASDPEAAEIIGGMKLIGAFGVSTPSGGSHWYARWPEGRPRRTTRKLRTKDGRLWGDLKGGGAPYVIAPGQRSHPDDDWAGYWAKHDDEATLPRFEDLPEVPEILARMICKAARRRAPAAEAKRDAKRHAANRRRRVQRRAKKRAATRCKLAARMPSAAGERGAWVDRAVERDGMQRALVRQKPAHGCHDWMLAATQWAAGTLEGPARDAAEERLWTWWRRWNGGSREWNGMVRKFGWRTR